MVRIFGLNCQPRVVSGSMDHDQITALGANVHDMTARFDTFRRGLIDEFGQAGMADLSLKNRAVTNPIFENRADHMKIIDTKGMCSDTLLTSSTPAKNSPYTVSGRTRRLRFNA